MINKRLDQINTKISSILKTDLRYLIKGGSALGSIEVVSAVIGFISTIAFANLLAPDTFGTYKYILSVYSFFVLATMPGIDNALVRSISQGFDGDYTLGLKTKFRWGIIGTGLLIMAGVYNYLEGHTLVGLILIMISPLLPIFESAYLYTSVLNGKKMFTSWAKMENISNIISTAIMLLTISQTTNLFFIVGSYFLPYLIIRTIYTLWIIKNITVNKDTSPDLVTYGKSLTAYQITTRAANAIDQIVLFHVLGPAQLAIFSIAQAIPARMQGVFRISGLLSAPKFANQNYADVKRSLPKKIFYFALVILIICSAYATIAPFVFKWFFPKYLSSASYSRVLVFYTISAITYPLGSLLLAHKKISQNYIISLSGLVVKIITLIIAIPLFGIWGAVLSVILHSLTVSVASLGLIYGRK